MNFLSRRFTGWTSLSHSYQRTCLGWKCKYLKLWINLIRNGPKRPIILVERFVERRAIWYAVGWSADKSIFKVIFPPLINCLWTWRQNLIYSPNSHLNISWYSWCCKFEIKLEDVIICCYGDTFYTRILFNTQSKKIKNSFITYSDKH
jgi:hypothetical protein